MLQTWYNKLAQAIRGQRRTEAQPEPRSWRGEPLADVGADDPGDDPYRTLSLHWVLDGPANSPATGAPPAPPAPEAQGLADCPS